MGRATDTTLSLCNRPDQRRRLRCGPLLVAGAAAAGLLAGCTANLDELLGRGQPEAATLTISPARGSVLGGTRVTIRGVNAATFQEGTEVLLGGFLGRDVEIVNESTVAVTTPAQAAGAVEVTVRLPDGTAITYPNGFQYVSLADADAEILAEIEAMFPGAPHVVSAVSTSNTGVRVTFSEPVRNSATDPANYGIVIPEGGILLVDRSKPPVLSDDQTVANLTTLSQADALYSLTATGIRDLAGNPIAPPDMLINPSEATFVGIAPSHLDEHIDTDGDGFADWFEMLGWQITIELADGQQVQGYVTSDPYNPDTDGDGLTDGEENARSMDPRTDDTDADLVLDMDEVFTWRSNPCDQDSDDDGFADETELHFQTSLILADTDGDQLSDRDELLNRDRNPRIADLPIPVITVGEMNIELDERYTYVDQFGREQQIQESYSDTVQRDESSSVSDTNSSVTRMHIEGKVGARAGIEVGAEVGKGDLGPIAKAYGKIWGEGHFEVSGGLAREKTHSTTWQSSQSTSHTYNEAVNRVSQISSTSSVTRETVAARMSAAVTIGAGSDIAFQLSNLEISVLQEDPGERSRLVPIATLVPNEPDAVYSVGPLAPEIGPLIFQNSEIFPSMAEALMKDPRGLLFEVANFDITDELDRNFAFTGQEIVERTARITIDFGNGESETYRIATAGSFDAQGRPEGISMADALRAIGLLPWEGEDPELGSVDNPNDPRPKPTDPDIVNSFGMRTVSVEDEDGQETDVRIVTRVRGVQDDFDIGTVEPLKGNDGGFWVVFVTVPNPEGPTLRGTTDFDTARLHAGEAYILAFVKDKDRDLLTSLEEFFSGSSDALTDTDNDDLGDFLEVRGQWNDTGTGAWLVYTDRLPGGYRSYAAPYMADSDDDGLSDGEEYALCRYGYEGDGSVPAGAFATETTENGVATWDVLPENLPDVFPPSAGLPHGWHTQLDADTGLPVRFPTNRASLDPRKADTDEDGISDADEVNGYYVDMFDDNPIDTLSIRVFVRSDPLSTDTDGDGLLDGMEKLFGTNPVSTDANTVLDDDLDGLPNRVELSGWLVTIDGVERRMISDPSDPDSDNDYIPDYVEWVLGTNPWYDCDPDQELNDCYQNQPGPDDLPPGYDTDEDGLNDYEEWNGTVPPQDLDKLAFCDFVPNCAAYPPNNYALGTNPAVADTDDDGINDGAEVTGWTVHLEGSPAGYNVSSNPLVADTDNDGLPDGDEYTRGTDPTLADTDGDETSDAVELARGRNPLVRDQRITVTFMILDVIQDGWPTGPYGLFQFEFRVWPSTASYPITAVHSDDVVDNLEICIPDFGRTPCRYMACSPEYILAAVESGTMWVLPGNEASRSVILPDGEYFILDGWVWASDHCPSVWIPDWDYEWYFRSANAYTTPTSTQLFTFSVTGVDNDGDPVELGLTGQIRVD